MRRFTAFLAACLLPMLALATVPSETYQVTYAGNDVSTTFAVPFQFNSSTSLRVAVRNNTTGAVTEITTGFTVTGAGTDSGEVEFDTAPATGTTVVIGQAAEMLQETDYVPNDVFSAESHEAALDNLTLIAHRLDEQFNRSISVPFGDANAGENMELPAAPERAGKYLYFDETTGAPEPAEELEAGTTLSASVIGGYIYPESAAETTAGVTPTDLTKPYGHTDRYGGVCDGVEDDTAAVQAAINVASEDGSAATVQAGTCLVDTLTIDASNFTIEGGGQGSVLEASTNIPASGAILLSLAGGADATVNQALLDGIYGAAVQSVRTNVTNSLENVVIRDLTLRGNANAIRGVWATGFTRGSRIENVHFEGIDGDAIALNGSWSFTLANNHIDGDDLGTGMSLGRSGYGERGGSSVVNAAHVVGNTINGNANGVVWNFGSGLFFGGNTVELNTGDGFQSQSGAGATIVGNYIEGNDGDNMQIGGTNGTDFFEGCQIIGNTLSNNSGNNIRLQGTERCRIGPNYFSGTVTQHYFIGAGIGQYITESEIWVPAVSSTYITNPSELDATDNYTVLTDSFMYRAPVVRAQTALESVGTLFVAATGSIDAAAIAQFDSTAKAVVIPRMTEAQMNAISSPPDGSIIYATDTDKLMVRANGAWVAVH